MNTLLLGKSGEDIAEVYLKGLGHSILRRNYRNRSGEIDIVSLKESKIYFTEVKTWRSNILHPLEAFHKKKCARMRIAAGSFFYECGWKESDFLVSFCLLTIKNKSINFYVDLF
ncbi:MAG: YraN family protein [Leptospiraceae bacterium]|nr:YraN family protein [Leptospiraceae bacterium]MCP5511797.1 YraN family protein [Leptospiraceae bacterium]